MPRAGRADVHERTGSGDWSRWFLGEDVYEDEQPWVAVKTSAPPTRKINYARLEAVNAELCRQVTRMRPECFVVQVWGIEKPPTVPEPRTSASVEDIARWAAWGKAEQTRRGMEAEYAREQILSIAAEQLDRARKTGSISAPVRGGEVVIRYRKPQRGPGDFALLAKHREIYDFVVQETGPGAAGLVKVKNIPVGSRRL